MGHRGACRLGRRRSRYGEPCIVRMGHPRSVEGCHVLRAPVVGLDGEPRLR